MKIVVSHAQKQHVYRLVYALCKENRLKKFYTALYFKDNGIITKFFKLSKKTSKLIQKRRFEGLNDSKITLTILPEITSKILSKINCDLPNFYAQRVHDKIVSLLLRPNSYDAIIGYETQALSSFKKAKKHGAITILDAASIYYQTVAKINEDNNYIIRPKEKVKNIYKEGKVKSEELKYTDYIIALSEFSKKSYINGGFPESRIRTISLGINISLFSQKESYANEKFEIIFVAGIRHLKGIKDLIEAFESLNLNNSLLTIVGNKSDAYDYVEKHLSENIKYISHVDHKKLSKLYQNASIFVLPTYIDSFPQVVFEAMSCGTPVITTTHSAAHEILNDGDDGFIIEPGDQDKLKDKILYFYNNPNEIERMGKNARKKVEKLTWENYYKNINKIIEEILNESRTSN